MMRSVVLALFGAALTGCGIDRGGAPDMTENPGFPTQIEATLVAGPINAISADTITIDDVTITTDNAQLEVDGAAAALDMLRIGQYAVVVGSTPTNSATIGSTVVITSEVIGVASVFDPNDNQLTVLAQQVILTDNTALDPTLAVAALGDAPWREPLRVSGIADSLGRIYATRIAPDTNASRRLTGFATSVDEANLSFRIGTLPVSYINAAVIDLPDAAPSENERVTLTGDLQSGAFDVDTISDAPLVPAFLRSDAIVRLTAAVTQPLADDAFAIAFIDATLNANATLSDGTAADVAPGAVVSISGRWSTDQTLRVQTVRIVRPAAP